MHCLHNFIYLIFGCAGSLLLHGLLTAAALLFWGTGSRAQASAVVATGLRCSTARGTFPDQGLKPRLLHWQVDSLPLSHKGSPLYNFKIEQ